MVRVEAVEELPEANVAQPPAGAAAEFPALVARARIEDGVEDRPTQAARDAEVEQVESQRRQGDVERTAWQVSPHQVDRDRKRVEEGKSVSVRVDLGGSRRSKQ